MSDMIVSVTYTLGGGLPATGLTLAQIAFYLTAVNKATGAETIIWNGAQNPTLELTAIGQYVRRYATADFATYDYCAMAQYSGPVILDSDFAYGTASGTPLGGLFPAGAIDFTYTVTDSVTLMPIQGADVWFSTDVAGLNIIWKGVTDVFGVARDVFNNLPWLDAGVYQVWVQRAGYAPSLFPDVEVAS